MEQRIERYRVLYPPPGPRPSVRVTPTHGRTTLCPQPLEQSRGDSGVGVSASRAGFSLLSSPLPTLDFCFVTLFNAT